MSRGVQKTELFLGLRKDLDSESEGLHDYPNGQKITGNSTCVSKIYSKRNSVRHKAVTYHMRTALSRLST